MATSSNLPCPLGMEGMAAGWYDWHLRNMRVLCTSRHRPR